jgi:hypothetical protein
MTMRRLAAVVFFAVNLLGISGAVGQIFSGTNFRTVPSPNSAFGATAMADYDNDGDLDFIATGLDASSNTITQIYKNTPAGFSIVTSPALPNVYNGSVGWGDYNNDGLLDLVITGDTLFNNNESAVAKIFKNTGAGFVEQFAGTLLPMHLGNTEWFDYNNDGLLDLLVTGIHPVISGSSFTDQYLTKLYRNTGSSFTEVFAGQFSSVGYSSVDASDFNNDGLIDFIVSGSRQGGIAPLEESTIYQNTGNGFTVAFASQIAGVSFGSIKWWDYNLDGKPDVVLCGANNGAVIGKVYRNNGTGFTEVFANTLTAGSAGVIDLGDYDNDGKLDLIHNGSYQGSKFVEIIKNDSSSLTPMFAGTIPGIDNGIVSWGDYDGDGDLDILAFGYQPDESAVGNIYLNSNGSNVFTVNQKPNSPPSPSQTILQQMATLSWKAATDAETPSSSIQYNFYVRQGVDTLYGAQSIKRGKRKVVKYGNAGFAKSTEISLPPGDYYWSVQSIDNDFQGSAFSTESFFHVLAAPVATAATLASATGFTANWNSVIEATGYQLDLSTDNFNTYVNGYSSQSETGTSTVVTGLTPGTTYQYRVRATDASGVSATSNVISIVTIPMAPVAGAANNVTATGFIANWNGVTGATSYQLDISTDNFATFVTGYNSTSISGTNQVVIGLLGGTTYQYQVRAVDASGVSANSNVVSVLTIPSAPIAIAATSVSTTSFVANWNGVTGGNGYQVDVSANNFSTFVAGYNSSSIINTTDTIFGLTVGTAYQFRVRAVNPSGTSANSNVVTVTTNKLNQNIVFETIADVTVGGPAFTLSATDSSHLAVVYSASSKKVTLNGNVVTIVSAGRDTITATQPGNATYNAATPVAHSFCINPSQPTITLSNNNTATRTLTSSASVGNQWFLNGSAITGATGTTLIVSDAGTYTVQTTTADGCASVVSANFPVIVTGDLPIAQSVSLYPNPSRDYIFINGIEEQVTASSVIDMVGRSSTIKLDQQGVVLSGDIRNLATGMYILKVTTGTSITQIKFIKQ